MILLIFILNQDKIIVDYPHEQSRNLAELPKLDIADRREIFDRICEMEERDLISGVRFATGERPF